MISGSDEILLLLLGGFIVTGRAGVLRVNGGDSGDWGDGGLSFHNPGDLECDVVDRRAGSHNVSSVMKASSAELALENVRDTGRESEA